MFSISTALVLLLACVLLCRAWAKLEQLRCAQRVSKDPAICREIIAGKLEHNGLPNILSPHEARAIPNRRLRIVFGIDNAFIRADSVHATAFVDRVRPLINLSAKEWANVSEFARITTSHWINYGFPRDKDCKNHCCEGKKHGDRRQINVASLSQLLSLKVVLWLMFDRKDQYQICDGSLLRLAQSINRVWVSSKLDDTKAYIPRFEDDPELRASLFGVFGEHFGPENNPLNLILPSFETMWRVVLRAFLEIGFVTGKEIPAWWETMLAFAEQPSKRQFDYRPPSSNALKEDADKTQKLPSAKHIVQESLRLYVPTRRIHRAYQYRATETSWEIRSADIEGCHLRADIWGSDTERFNPNRWSALTPAQRDAFMPFGSAPFECPAKPTFAPRMIGILVGSLLAALDKSQSKAWYLDCEDGEVLEQLESGERLCPHRNAYMDLYLVRSVDI
ncbi:hypothetical protein N7457_002934 [Penicillium paradoxum]|uniref:uncharacterized protein n=1 Tax=Penicillium paradoxum TaxID=176176 RepID=UPI002547327E|nr:uncharacterized protein N7457_002934 [Penicillium paradoxum]KAJ5787944.1 hypothetical protein N7457_002934 [Penicillium paradoxum]